MAKRWKLNYFSNSRKETTFHATRDAAMKALYDRLDLEQRDAIAMGDAQRRVDYLGKLRGGMASAWRDVTHKKAPTCGILYQNDVARIVRNV